MIDRGKVLPEPRLLSSRFVEGALSARSIIGDDVGLGVEREDFGGRHSLRGVLLHSQQHRWHTHALCCFVEELVLAPFRCHIMARASICPFAALAAQWLVCGRVASHAPRPWS